jgi:hypothetical protein
MRWSERLAAPIHIYHEIPPSTRTDALSRQPSLILFSLDDRPVEPTSQPSAAQPLQKPLGWVPYAIGAASFIPAVGVLFGLVAIIVGIAQRARIIIILGASGILFSVLLYAALFSSGGIYARLGSGLAGYVLHDAVKEIEAYKLQHGRYPASLSEIEPKGKERIDNFIDPTATHGGGTLNGRFHYQLDPSGEFYYLRSVGPDGIPFTSDDILPNLTEDERKKTGLRLQR